MQHAIKNYGADLSLAQQKALLGMQACHPLLLPPRSAPPRSSPGARLGCEHAQIRLERFWSHACVLEYSEAQLSLAPARLDRICMPLGDGQEAPAWQARLTAQHANPPENIVLMDDLRIALNVVA